MYPGYDSFPELPHDDKMVYSITGKDINKMIIITKTLMNIKPQWNERLMGFLAKLHQFEPSNTLTLEDIMEEVGIIFPKENGHE